MRRSQTSKVTNETLQILKVTNETLLTRNVTNETLLSRNVTNETAWTCQDYTRDRHNVHRTVSLL